MAASALTGSRIRTRRIDLGLKQATLAQQAGISPAYLSLIEHDRRRIGGKVLRDLAQALGVEVQVLTKGSEATLLAGLRGAAAGTTGAEPEIAKTEEFAGRFPGWARLVAGQARRITALEHLAGTLTDRLTHDPYLSAALHEVLSTVTAIRSTTGILNETPDLDRSWRDRFHRNLAEDSQRLADSSRALVAYLDRDSVPGTAPEGPQQELEAWLGTRGYHLPECEGSTPADDKAVINAAALGSVDARILARNFLRRYRRDARALPLGDFTAAAAEQLDPGLLAMQFGVSPATVLRRLAVLPAGRVGAAPGLVICDGAGALIFRKPVEGFPLPSFGAACPLWPLYQALSQPMVPIRATVELPGRPSARFATCAIAEPARPAAFARPTVFKATMLILPATAGGAGLAGSGGVQPVGISCRICPRARCDARREPSMLGQTGM